MTTERGIPSSFWTSGSGKSAEAFTYLTSELHPAHFAKTIEWNEEMSAVLAREVANRSSDIDWKIVSEELFRQCKAVATPMECLMRYRNVVDPSINNTKWSQPEIDRLADLVAFYNEHEWCSVAEELGTNRTPMDCLKYYQRHLNTSLSKANDRWSEEEELQLKQSVEQYGTSDWASVARDLPGRTARQCFNRHRRSAELQNSFGGVWLEAEERMLYFACTCMKAPMSSSSKKSAEELEQLLSGARSSTLVQPTPALDFQGWTAVADLMPGKTDVQCREKWTSNLDPTVNVNPFAAEEDALLLRLVELIGEGRWTEVASYMVGRTDAAVRSRYTALTRQPKSEAARVKRSRKK